MSCCLLAGVNFWPSTFGSRCCNRSTIGSPTPVESMSARALPVGSTILRSVSSLGICCQRSKRQTAPAAWRAMPTVQSTLFARSQQPQQVGG